MQRLNKEEFKTKLNSGEYTLLDIRTSQEQVIYGIISDQQIHIDIYKSDAMDKIQKLPREGKYLVYCFHGNRSQYVLQVMQELGFNCCFDLMGGLVHW